MPGSGQPFRIESYLGGRMCGQAVRPPGIPACAQGLGRQAQLLLTHTQGDSS